MLKIWTEDDIIYAQWKECDRFPISPTTLLLSGIKLIDGEAKVDKRGAIALANVSPNKWEIMAMILEGDTGFISAYATIQPREKPTTFEGKSID